MVACRGFWPEERQWLAGLSGQGTCEACFEAIGSAAHRLHECAPLQSVLVFARLEDRLPPLALPHWRNPSLAPLAYHALPPREGVWQPTAAGELEGDISFGHDGISFGDGSGKQQHEIESAVATWAVVRKAGDLEVSRVRGRVDGWFATVPRAELTALVWHLRSASSPATYIGDCKEVIRGVAAGAPAALTSSKSLHADLWRLVGQLLHDHGVGLSFTKTKAHRSQAEAVRSIDDPVDNWMGNQAADAYAKELCITTARDDLETESFLGFVMLG